MKDEVMLYEAKVSSSILTTFHRNLMKYCVHNNGIAFLRKGEDWRDKSGMNANVKLAENFEFTSI